MQYFFIIGSAAVVSAADVNGDGYAGSNYQDDLGGWAGSQYDGGYAGSNYQDDLGGWAGSQYQDMGGWAGCQYNQTNNNITANSTAHAAGNPNHNLTAHAATNTTNSTNSTNATSPSTLSATGNPILLLLGICAVLGGYTVFRRKN